MVRPTTLVASDDLPLQVDQLQYELDEGPCVQALERSDAVLVNELPTSQEFPRFGPKAAELTGVLSMLSMRLYITGQHRAALNFYASKPFAFDAGSVATAAIFASYASLVETNRVSRDENMHLSRALESNREIGVAIGILMARDLVTNSQAFDQLRIASQGLHRKLRDIAQDVIETGTLPEYPSG